MLASRVRILDHWDCLLGLDDGYGESSQLEPIFCMSTDYLSLRPWSTESFFTSLYIPFFYFKTYTRSHGTMHGDIAMALWVVYEIPKHGMG
jgi:hypothetical protein